jgi:deoxyribose-phosphate aldolase
MPDPTSITVAELASFIDHTILKPEAISAQVVQFCAEARDHGFRSVCINPIYAKVASEALKGTSVAVCSVVGFPFGAIPTQVKAAETAAAVEAGAQEIDMVLAIGALKAGFHRQVSDDIRAVRRACPEGLLKVIIETCLLTDEEKRIACDLAVQAGADFVKTSTGYSKGGATVQDVTLMRREVGSTVGVKASGGIRSLEQALAMIGAGATRLGLSASLAVVAEAVGQLRE